jgi:PAS domain S-box-containing protein
MNDTLLVLDAEGVIRLVNHAAEKLFGLQENDILEKQINDLIDDVVFQNLKANIRQGKNQHYEYHYRHPERYMIVISLSASEMVDGSGKLLAIILIARDITEKKRAEDLLRMAFDEMEMRVQERTAELADSNAALTAEILDRKRTEEALRQSEERYRLLTEISPNSVTVADTTGNIIMANQRALKIYGHRDVSEVLGRNIFEWVPLEEREKASTAFAHVLGGCPLDNFELLLKKGQGDLFRASVNASLVRDKEGNPQFVIIVTTDINERKSIERSS